MADGAGTARAGAAKSAAGLIWRTTTSRQINLISTCMYVVDFWPPGTGLTFGLTERRRADLSSRRRMVGVGKAHLRRYGAPSSSFPFTESEDRPASLFAMRCRLADGQKSSPTGFRDWQTGRVGLSGHHKSSYGYAKATLLWRRRWEPLAGIAGIGKLQRDHVDALQYAGRHVEL